ALVPLVCALRRTESVRQTRDRHSTYYLSPLRGLLGFQLRSTQGLRPGLHSFAALRLRSALPQLLVRCGGGSWAAGFSVLATSAMAFALRQTLTTASVQKGTRSTPGTSLAKNDGKNSQ